jgi:hypothetical protein
VVVELEQDQMFQDRLVVQVEEREVIEKVNLQ